MQFRIQVPIKQENPKIDYNSKLLLIGSCFVENIGNKLEYYKLQNFRNPFGILYHPAAIANFFKKTAEVCVYTENDIFFHNERWHCFDAHSVLSSPEKEELLNKLNFKIQETRAFLCKASHVVITLGTAWAYKNIAEAKQVANCHKLPQKNFSKHLYEPVEIVTNLESLISYLYEINPALHVIFTISPIRHIKDGMVENQLSKAHLITAVHKLIQLKSEEGFSQIHYFPAYEIMMDELRDYRFYAEDMLHPSAVAIEYIWERFVNAWFSSEAVAISKKVENIQKGLSHRAFNEKSEAHQRFVNKIQKNIHELRSQIPHLQF